MQKQDISVARVDRFEHSRYDEPRWCPTAHDRRSREAGGTVTVSAVVAQSPWSPGSLVRVRGRDWVVLPPDPDAADLMRLRPITGTDAEAIGLLMQLGEAI